MNVGYTLLNSTRKPSLSGDLQRFLTAVGEFLASRSVNGYLVGGFVRDLLLGRDSEDVDLAVDGDVFAIGQGMADAFGGTFVSLDEKRGMARVVLHPQSVVRHLDLISYSEGIQMDLARRDFTIDAMAIPLEQVASEDGGFSIADPYDGANDLRRGLIRKVSDGAFKEDPLRLLRGARLSVQLGFAIEEETREAIARDASLLSGVAAERVRDELLKLLAEPRSSASLRLLDGLGLLCILFPELEEARGVSQPKEHYWDVLDHSIETSWAVEKVVRRVDSEETPALRYLPWHPQLEGYFSQGASDGHDRLTFLKLAGLLHDIGKPATKTVEPSGRMRFFGHSELGADMVEAALQRLRFSSRGVAMVREMVRHHLRPGQMTQPGELPTRRAIYRYFRDLKDVAVDTLYLNLADYLAARGPTLELQEWARHCQMIGYVLSEGLEVASPQAAVKLVDGHAVMEAFNLTPGPIVGRLLVLVQEAQGAGEIETQEQALALIQEHLRGAAHDS